MAITTIAIILSFAAASFYAVASHLQTLEVRDVDIRRGTVISLCTMALLFWLLAPFFIEWHWWGTRAAVIFALCGIVFPAASQSLSILSMARVGPAIGSALGSFGPVFAILPAVMFLGDSLSAQGVGRVGSDDRGAGSISFGAQIAQAEFCALGVDHSAWGGLFPRRHAARCEIRDA